MNTRFFLRMRILFCAMMFTFITFAVGGGAVPGKTSAAKGTASGGLKPDTLLVKLQADPNQPPIELTLKQFMEKYR